VSDNYYWQVVFLPNFPKVVYNEKSGEQENPAEMEMLV
jgi:hypothetical protein